MSRVRKEPKNQDFWELFEIYSAKNVDHVPRILKEVLQRSGYDSASTILALDGEKASEKVKEIEQYVTDCLLDLVKQNKAYSNISDTFHFLPGHKTFLSLLPSKVLAFQKSAAIQNRRPGKSLSSCNKHANELGSDKEEEIEVQSEEELTNLKKKLLDKLNSRSNSSSKFTLDEISAIDLYISKNARPGNTSYKCIVKCHSCDSKIPCTFTTYWQTGNLEKHIKKNMVCIQH